VQSGLSEHIVDTETTCVLCTNENILSRATSASWNKVSPLWAKHIWSVVRKEISWRPLGSFGKCPDSWSALKLPPKFENSFLRRSSITLATSEWMIWEMRCGWEAAETILGLPPAGQAAMNAQPHTVQCLSRQLGETLITPYRGVGRYVVMTLQLVTKRPLLSTVYQDTLANSRPYIRTAARCRLRMVTCRSCILGRHAKMKLPWWPGVPSISEWAVRHMLASTRLSCTCN
jgi:hypothetical protein